MKIISEKDKFINKIVGEGKIINSTYRLFTYILKINIDDGVLFENTLTGELIYLNEDEEIKLNKLPCLYESWMDDLIKDHFLVLEETNDKNFVDVSRKIAQTLAANFQKNITEYVVFPTTNCNARCFYCFEHCREDFKYENMSKETADKLINFIKEKHGDKEVKITWFGGEPLLANKLITYISKSLIDLGISFKSNMASNCFLFNEELVETAKNVWHLEEVQVTIDGTEEKYNEIKNYVGVTSSAYRKVIGNIELLASFGIKVSILLNVGLENGENLLQLTDQLVTKFKGKENIFICFQKLYESCGANTRNYTDEEYAYLNEIEDSIMKKSVEFFRKDEDYEKNLQLSYSSCLACNSNAIVVVPSGKLTKCNHCIQNHFVGDLDVGIINDEEIEGYKRLKLFNKCSKCPCYPTCLNLEICEKFTICRDVDQEARIEWLKQLCIKKYKNLFYL